MDWLNKFAIWPAFAALGEMIVPNNASRSERAQNFVCIRRSSARYIAARFKRRTLPSISAYARARKSRLSTECQVGQLDLRCAEINANIPRGLNVLSIIDGSRPRVVIARERLVVAPRFSGFPRFPDDRPRRSTPQTEATLLRVCTPTGKCLLHSNVICFECFTSVGESVVKVHPNIPNSDALRKN